MDSYTTLNDGNKFPMLGFGTYQITGASEIYRVLDCALEAGYRSIDTAGVYRNEADIGRALRELLPKYGLSRQDVYITSKLPPSNQGGGENTRSAVLSSLRDLQTDYLDLYLIHWPGTSRLDVKHPDNAANRHKSWLELVQLKKEGLIRSIGVSNYTVRHLHELLENCGGVTPAVNQVEWHPHHWQSQLLQACRSANILLQAYSSLGGSRNPALLQDARVLAVSAACGRSAAQVLLRWALQRNVAVIPKATGAQRIQDNTQLDFQLSQEHMDVLDNIGTTRQYAWNPDTIK